MSSSNQDSGAGSECSVKKATVLESPHCNGFNGVTDDSQVNSSSSNVLDCTNQSLGCNWKGSPNQLKAHIDIDQRQGDCQYQTVQCQYSCGYETQRQSLSDHEHNHCLHRPYKCQYCQYENSYQDVTELHQRTCLKFPVSCPYNCGQVMTRYGLVSHIESECSLVPLACPFTWAGCRSNLSRNGLSDHLQDHQVEHLSLVSEACSELQRENVQLKENNQELSKSNADLKSMCNQLYSAITAGLPTLPIRIAYSSSDELEKTVSFYSSKYGYRMSLTYTRSPMVFDSEAFMKQKRDVIFDKCELTIHNGVFDQQLEWPFSRNIILNCVIRHNGAAQCLKLTLTHQDSDEPRTLFLSPLPPLDEEDDRQRFLVHVIYTGDDRPWICESVEIECVQ